MPVVATNIPANSTVNYLNFNASDQSTSLSKIASGSKIAKAADDAAGLAISTNVTTDVRVLKQASANVSQAIAILQTAEGAAASISDILLRMRALAVEACSGTVTDQERAFINAEFTKLVTDIDYIAMGTRYSGRPLICNVSSFGAVVVGTDAADTLTLDPSSFDLCATGLGVNDDAVNTQSAALAAWGAVDLALDNVLGARASFGAQQSQFRFQASTDEMDKPFHVWRPSFSTERRASRLARATARVWPAPRRDATGMRRPKGLSFLGAGDLVAKRGASAESVAGPPYSSPAGLRRPRAWFLAVAASSAPRSARRLARPARRRASPGPAAP